MKARDLLIRSLGDLDEKTLSATFDLADIYKLQGKYEDVAKVFAYVSRVRTAILGESHTLTLSGHDSLANVYIELGRHEDAGKAMSFVWSDYSQNERADSLASLNCKNTSIRQG